MGASEQQGGGSAGAGGIDAADGGCRGGPGSGWAERFRAELSAEGAGAGVVSADGEGVGSVRDREGVSDGGGGRGGVRHRRGWKAGYCVRGGLARWGRVVVAESGAAV